MNTLYQIPFFLGWLLCSFLARFASAPHQGDDRMKLEQAAIACHMMFENPDLIAPRVKALIKVVAVWVAAMIILTQLYNGG